MSRPLQCKVVHKPNHRVGLFGTRVVRALEAATLAPVREPPAAVTTIDGDRTHQAAAGGCPIARMDIDMFAGEAGGAVVRVAVADVERSAAFAGEIFDAPLETAPGFAGLGHCGELSRSEEIRAMGAYAEVGLFGA